MKRHTVAVRPWAAGDSEAASAWWHECWTSAGVVDKDIPLPGATIKSRQCEADVLAITLGGLPCGLVVSSSQVVILVAIRADLRGWGYGSQAISIVENRFPVRAVLASPGVGLSLYFWLRLGYAPLAKQPYSPAALLLEKVT